MKIRQAINPFYKVAQAKPRPLALMIELVEAGVPEL